ncbi:MAG: hypothetical protein ACYC8T_01635 [Myxococcaceae bacterium]
MDPQTPSGNGAQGHPQHATVTERVEHLGQSAQHLYSDARGAATDLGDLLDLKGRVQRNPYAMLAAAAGVGYVLGGGLFTPLTGRMVRLGFRLAALPFVKDELVSMAEAAVDGFIAGAKATSEPASEPGPEKT